MLFVLQGISGGGKSTLVGRLAADPTLAPLAVASADAYPGLYGERQPDGSVPFNWQLLSAAHGACMRAVIDALREGRNVVVDNTNTSNEEVAPYLLVAAAYGATARIIRVSCDPETAWKRNTHGVPYAVVKIGDGPTAVRATRTPETYTPGEGALVGGVLAMHERLMAYKGLPHWPQPETL